VVYEETLGGDSGLGRRAQERSPWTERIATAPKLRDWLSWSRRFAAVMIRHVMATYPGQVKREQND
jgi:hypothetical protein